MGQQTPEKGKQLASASLKEFLHLVLSTVRNTWHTNNPKTRLCMGFSFSFSDVLAPCVDGGFISIHITFSLTSMDRSFSFFSLILSLLLLLFFFIFFFCCCPPPVGSVFDSACTCHQLLLSHCRLDSAILEC